LFLLEDIRLGILSKFPKPKPPVMKVRIGVDELETETENRADPDYHAKLKQHQAVEGRAYLESLVEVSVECEIDTEKVKRIRAWAEKNGITLPESDLILYVTRVALETAKDVTFFKDAVLSQSQPTEKGIEKSLQTFRAPGGNGSNRADLQGAEHLRVPSPP